MYRSFTPNCFITGFSCLLSFIELSRFFGIAPVSFHVFGTVIGEYGNIISRALKETSLFILIGEEVFVISFIGVIYFIVISFIDNINSNFLCCDSLFTVFLLV